MYTHIWEIYKVYLAVGCVVSTDSRRAAGIFFALRGDRFDAHDFVAAALSSGAQYAVVERLVSTVPADRQLLVEDTEAALQRLATYHRRTMKIPFIALTGTNGKTTTKELARAALSPKYKVSATSGNLNNHIGVPLTLLSIPADTQIAIIEMGANHPGEIDFLCNIAEPDYGLITNIGRAHLEGFGSYEGVKRTKSELYHYFDVDRGTIFYNSSDNTLTELVNPCPCRKIAYSIPFTDALSTPDGSLTFAYQGHNYTTHLSGIYNLPNIAAALAIATHFQVPQHESLTAIAEYVPENNRSQIVQTSQNTLFLDAYNANPSSMEASIANFAAQTIPRKIYILGDMLELGQYAKQEHQNIINILRSLDVKDVLLVGINFADTKHKPYLSFDSTDSLSQYLSENKPASSNILIKGSRGLALEKIIPML